MNTNTGHIWDHKLHTLARKDYLKPNQAKQQSTAATVTKKHTLALLTQPHMKTQGNLDIATVRSE